LGFDRMNQVRLRDAAKHDGQAIARADRELGG
jgi:hypothetical protein